MTIGESAGSKLAKNFNYARHTWGFVAIVGTGDQAIVWLGSASEDPVDVGTVGEVFSGVPFFGIGGLAALFDLNIALFDLNVAPVMKLVSLICLLINVN